MDIPRVSHPLTVSAGRYSAAMNRQATWVVVAVAIVAVLLAAVATSGEVHLAERAPSIPWKFGSAANPDQFEFPQQSESAERAADEITPITWPRFLTVILQALLIGALVALAAVVLVFAWRHRPRVTIGKDAPDDFDVLDEFAASVTADADEQFAMLRGGVARNAIVSCWLRLENLAVAADVEHPPADTSAELAARVLSRFAVDENAITTLSALYREARFSDHEMGESARAQALVALDAVHEGLRRRAEPRVGS